MISAEVLRKVQRLVGTPWDREARNCWHLTREIVALFGVDLPAVFDIDADNDAQKARAFAHHPERARWRVVERPNDWAVALLTRPGHLYPTHCGVFLGVDGGLMFHSDSDHGAVLDSLPQLALRSWIPTYLIPNVDRSSTQ